jgi:Protein of unknown function (DUF1549)/Protein of unknown function (DUF1553)
MLAAGPDAHWAFQRIVRPPLPAVRNQAWIRNPVDRFVLAKLEAVAQHPAPPASSQALLRRSFLDLTGLPPTLAEQRAFEKSIAASPSSAHDGLIDDLLARPAYGERWARHWLDLARYADSNGYERDAAKPFVWRYRDYVIRALNADKPFDRFLTEQLAGDELTDATAETIIATGFLRLGHFDDEPADPESDRFDQLDDIVRTASEAMLGLTLGCARCHDHKFEPLTQRDYYSMLAIFAPLERPVEGRTEKTVPTGDASAPEAYAWREASAQPPTVHILLRGNPSRQGAEVPPALPAILTRSGPALEFPRTAGRTTCRRLGLARWLTSDANPLTARVIVNLVWQQHFGEGLVRTPGDFGLMGERPSDPELLDWLADWFIHDAGWSLKKLHRVLLTSSAWQQQVESRDHGTADRKVFPPGTSPAAGLQPIRRRLEAEAIRDSMLAASGQLNHGMFGPPVCPPVPRAILEGNSDPDKIWPVSSSADASRRSVYVFLKRSMVVPMFEALDLNDTVHSCPKRQITTVSPQALILFNSEFTDTQARHFASRVKQEAGENPDHQILHAFRLALCRTPTSRELTTMREFLERESLDQLCRVIFNLNEFVYPD